MRRLNTFCSTRMSTQLWWLLATRYQPFGSRPSSPCTSQRTSPTTPIHQLFTAIHSVAIAFSARSVTWRTAVNGSSSLASANGTIAVTRIRTLSASVTDANTPLAVETIDMARSLRKARRAVAPRRLTHGNPARRRRPGTRRARASNLSTQTPALVLHSRPQQRCARRRTGQTTRTDREAQHSSRPKVGIESRAVRSCRFTRRSRGARLHAVQAHRPLRKARSLACPRIG